MGYSSYKCKRCGHGILSEDATDEGINEWMAEVVILAPNGNMTVDTQYTGYVGDYERFDHQGSVWLHKACWELAGRPDCDAFDGGSVSDDHQGAGGPHAHIIDPRIKNEDKRARLLANGLEKREVRHRRCVAFTVQDWFDDRSYHLEREQVGDEPWRLRYTYYQGFMRDDEGKPVLSDPGVPWSYVEDPTGWAYRDRLEMDEPEHVFTGTEDELKAHLASLWAQFLESDELKELLALREGVA